MTAVLVGGFVVAAASFLGGTTGFGYGLVATPLLLLVGFPLPFVVTVNLALSLVTRLSVAYRFRASVNRTRTALLICGSVPGLYLGARIITSVDPTVIKFAVGALVMTFAVRLAWRPTEYELRSHAGAVTTAGFAGGVLGTLSSLNGVVPVLLLARERVAPIAFVADLAVYFVVTNAIGLGILWATGGVSTHALVPDLLVWLPGSLAANAAGVALASKVPAESFRVLVLGIVFVAGAVTAAAVR